MMEIRCLHFLNKKHGDGVNSTTMIKAVIRAVYRIK